MFKSLKDLLNLVRLFIGPTGTTKSHEKVSIMDAHENTPVQSDSQATPAQIVDEVEKLVTETGVSIPPHVVNIIDTLVKGLTAVQSLVPEDKQAEIKEVEERLFNILKAIGVIEKESKALFASEKK